MRGVEFSPKQDTLPDSDSSVLFDLVRAQVNSSALINSFPFYTFFHFPLHRSHKLLSFEIKVFFRTVACLLCFRNRDLICYNVAFSSWFSSLSQGNISKCTKLCLCKSHVSKSVLLLLCSVIGAWHLGMLPSFPL